jgi:hypothetical protein
MNHFDASFLLRAWLRNSQDAHTHHPSFPRNTGIQDFSHLPLDPRFRGGDEKSVIGLGSFSVRYSEFSV